MRLRNYVTPCSACVCVAHVLNGNPANTFSMFTVNSCTGSLTPATPAAIATGFNPEGMVIDPSGKFVYVANLVSKQLTSPQSRCTLSIRLPES